MCGVWERSRALQTHHIGAGPASQGSYIGGCHQLLVQGVGGRRGGGILLACTPRRVCAIMLSMLLLLLVILTVLEVAVTSIQVAISPLLLVKSGALC